MRIKFIKMELFLNISILINKKKRNTCLKKEAWLPEKKIQAYRHNFYFKILKLIKNKIRFMKIKEEIDSNKKYKIK